MLFTALAVLRTSRSSLCPIPLATQLQDSKLCLDMEVSPQEATAAISLQSIQVIKKEREKSIKGSFHTPLEEWKKHPSQQGMITFNCKLFSVSYSNCLSANEAEARKSSSDLRWWHTSMAAARLVSWVWLCLNSPRWEFVGNCYT